MKQDTRDQTEIIPQEKMDEIARANVISEVETVHEVDLIPTTMIGKYRIIGRIGKGGMGDVYKAMHPKLDIPVAIKTISKKLAGSEKSVRRLVREAKLAIQINHPNVVRVYDVDNDGPVHFIVQEYIDGENLSRHLQSLTSGMMDAHRAIEIVTRVAHALSEINKHNIVHRDIKPSNILLTKNGEPKLADLGIARQNLVLSSSDGDLTISGSSLGSPAYMSPEQIADPKKVDIRSDIYALGVTFYQMVTGEVPFLGKSVQEILMKHLHETFTRPDEVNPRLPAAVSEVIAAMMEKNPDDRYQTPDELIEALHALDSVGGMKSVAEDMPEKSLAVPALESSPVKRRLAAAISVLAVGGVLLYFPLRQSGSTANRANVVEVAPSPEKMNDLRMMIREIGAKARETASADYWTSSPRILTFGPIEAKRDGTDANQIWADELFNVVQRQTGYPIVDRQSLPIILEELNLTVHDLTDPRAQSKLGRLLPASILLNASTGLGDGGETLFLKCIDMQTSEYSYIEHRISGDGKRSRMYDAIARKIKHEIRERFPIQGKVTAVSGERIEINLGGCHGVTEDTTLQVHPFVNVSSPRALDPTKLAAIAKVVQLDKFSANIGIIDEFNDVKPGMLVIEN